MSLLMEALRKAEQVKKQTAGIDSRPEPVARTTHPDEPLPPEPLPSRKRDENTVLGLLAGDEDRTTAPAAGAPNDALDLWNTTKDIKETTRNEDPAPFDLHLEEESTSGTGADRVMALPAAEIVRGVTNAEPDVQPGSKPPSIIAPEASAEASRQAARAVFVAKSKHQHLARKQRLFFIGVAVGLALLGAGGYLFFSYRSMTGLTAPITPVKRSTPPGAAVSTPKEAVTLEPAKPTASPLTDPKEETPGVRNNGGLSAQRSAGDQVPPPVQTGNTLAHTAPDSPQFSEAGTRSKIVPVSAGSPLPEAGSGSKSRQDLSVPQQEPEILPLPERPRPSQPAIKITHRGSQPQTDPLLATAYTAYQHGDLEQSRHNYLLILQTNPEHRGAMLGLAAVALRLQETALARDLYLRLLERDPSDPLAKVGLMTVMPKDDPVRLESELKLLLEVHPNMAPLSFSLGNIYAAGQRWNEAQQAYFNALQAASKAASPQGAVSPDYPFNLAVSLEHLNKPELAIRYYREAQKLATSLPVGFDKEALRQKLETLNGVEKQ